MTYEKLISLKYDEGLSTYELARQYPDQIELVSEVALLEVPEETLQEILTEEKTLKKLLALKKKFLRETRKAA